MRYLVLATDYDGTLARHGVVDGTTMAALQRFRDSGRMLVLVTGRLLDDLATVFPRLELFDRVVAENGAVLYRPGSKETKVLAEPPPARFAAALEARGVPIAPGTVIVGTEKPHETQVLEVIRDLGLELQVIFNKASVMVLPSGTNKATGLTAALLELGISPHNAVGVGDAENDHAFLSVCECGVAVGDALPSVRERADLVTRGGAGAGVVELCTRVLESDLAELEWRLARHGVCLGQSPDGSEVCLAPYGANVLLAGPSGSGKSTLSTALLEHLAEQQYQYVVIDPEGDYRTLENAVVIGDEKRAPTISEALDLLQKPGQNAVVNLLGIPLKDRPSFFDSLFPALAELRTRTGRPHWIIVDEAHHMLPPAWEKGEVPLDAMSGMLFITVHPETVAPKALSAVQVVLLVGEGQAARLQHVAETLGDPVPTLSGVPEKGKAVAWDRRAAGSAVVFNPAKPHGERRRHLRKYAEGELGPDRSFYFRGPHGKLQLRAQNLMMFLHMAEGVDDETWLHHLSRGDYSRWAWTMIKDGDLAADIARVEALANASPAESRSRIRAAIEQRYTLPA